MSFSKKIVLKSSDGETFVVDEVVALKSQTIKQMVDDDCANANNAIPLPNVTSKILAKVMKYCKKHVEANGGNATRTEERVALEELKSWDADFGEVDQD